MSSVLPRLSLATTSRDCSSRAASTNPILRLGFPVVCLCRASEHDNFPPGMSLNVFSLPHLLLVEPIAAPEFCDKADHSELKVLLTNLLSKKIFI
ncbi:hypothetical protein DSO57_1003755 [Entomophthora muscae]|uniref:Uncharacterized protein n=1 Tax=Entomophthora muscae TaxID=34485 RepID=A0ACC2TJC4_9FUNG|nr:hypothetical protein DSO57_1003755 [Entomophthora muscae]